MLHAMWVAVAAAVPGIFLLSLTVNALDHDPDFGRSWTGAVLLLMLLAPLWVPALAVTGAACGLAAALASRLLARAGRIPQTLGAGVAGGAVGTGASILSRSGGWQGLQSYDAVGLAVGAVSGALAVLLATRGRRTTKALPWAAATAVLAAISTLGASWSVVVAGHWDVTEECALQLAVAESQVAVAGRAFPPQTWCISLDTVEPSAPAWMGSALVLALTATIACALVYGWRAHGSARRSWAMVTVVLIVLAGGLTGAAVLLDPNPDPATVASARAELRARPTPPIASLQPTASSTPHSTEPSTPSADQARALLGRLAQAASTAVGTDGLWLASPRLERADCELTGGASGTVVSLTARFSARDPAEVHGRQAMAELSAANQQIGEAIVDAWVRSGSLTEPDVIHGQWWLGGRPGSPIETAHVGFLDGIGDLRVSSYCATE